MSARRYVAVPRPTEHAALRAVDKAPQAVPPVPHLMAALIEANDRGDRAGVNLCAHRAVRSAVGEVGEL